MRVPATYGFAALSGRTLADNAPEAMLSLVTNRPARKSSPEKSRALTV
jgi:hypothetical protein